MSYLLLSWKAFLKVKDEFDKWQKKKHAGSSIHKDNLDFNSVEHRFTEVPKVEYHFPVDKFESQSDVESDPNEW